jgi:hypothetical protein
LITIIEKTKNKAKNHKTNIKKTLNTLFGLFAGCRSLVKAGNRLGTRLTFEGVPQNPCSHGAHKGHISLLESYAFSVDFGKVGDYIICIRIIVKTKKQVTYAQIP